MITPGKKAEEVCDSTPSVGILCFERLQIYKSILSNSIIYSCWYIRNRVDEILTHPKRHHQAPSLCDAAKAAGSLAILSAWRSPPGAGRLGVFRDPQRRAPSFVSDGSSRLKPDVLPLWCSFRNSRRRRSRPADVICLLAAPDRIMTEGITATALINVMIRADPYQGLATLDVAPARRQVRSGHRDSVSIRPAEVNFTH